MILLKNTPKSIISSNHIHSFFFSSISRRPFSIFSVFIEPEPKNVEEKVGKSKKPLDVYFKEAVGLSEKKFEEIESEIDGENAELKKRLMKLEAELGKLKANRKDEKDKKEEARKDVETSKMECGTGSLSALFGAKPKESYKESSVPLTMDNREVYKELSNDMQLFAHHLYKRGYFKAANFLPTNKFDVTCFENSYGRDFLKFAAVQFGKDNQEISKWLSGSDLKRVALFGCPSVGKKTVFAAKRLRRYFRIQEDTVCSKCSLKESCKFVNQSVWKSDTQNLHLDVVMRIITLYAMESVTPKLVIPDEVKASVSRLLKEAMNLSGTLS